MISPDFAPAPTTAAPAPLSVYRMSNSAISKALCDVRRRLTGAGQEALRLAAHKHANVMVEARPGRLARRDAVAVLKRCEEAVVCK